MESTPTWLVRSLIVLNLLLAGIAVLEAVRADSAKYRFLHLGLGVVWLGLAGFYAHQLARRRDS